MLKLLNKQMFDVFQEAVFKAVGINANIFVLLKLKKIPFITKYFCTKSIFFCFSSKIDKVVYYYFFNL